MGKWKYKIVDSKDVPGRGIFKRKARTDIEGYLNDLGKDGIKVILVSLDGDAVQAGSGPILWVKCRGLHNFQRGALELSEVKIADINNKPLAANLAGASL